MSQESVGPIWVIHCIVSRWGNCNTWECVMILRQDCSYVFLFYFMFHHFLPTSPAIPMHDPRGRHVISHHMTDSLGHLPAARVDTCLAAYDYCTIAYAYIWTITAMSVHVWAYESWLSWTIDDNCLSPNGSNSNRWHEHSHHSTITILSFLTYHSH